VLAQMQLHATGVQSLTLQIGSSWTDYTAMWAWLGSTVSLTKLQLSFADEVSERAWACRPLPALLTFPSMDCLCNFDIGRPWALLCPMIRPQVC
jgi:hypothetical protein